MPISYEEAMKKSETFAIEASKGAEEIISFLKEHEGTFYTTNELLNFMISKRTEEFHKENPGVPSEIIASCVIVKFQDRMHDAMENLMSIDVLLKEKIKIIPHYDAQGKKETVIGIPSQSVKKK